MQPRRMLAAVTSLLAFLAGIGLLSRPVTAEATSESSFDQTLNQLENFCGDCHGDGMSEGGFSIDQIRDPSTLGDKFERWETIRQRLNDRSMPPADYDPLPSEARDKLVSWIDSATRSAIRQRPPEPGPPLLRRLARHEYSNTIRDLLNIHFDAGQGLPEDAAGGEGFSNAAETLTISPIHAEKYLLAATDALDYAAHDANARRMLLRHRADDADGEEAAATANLRQLARRAFRRPVSEEELARYVTLYRDARGDGLSFDEAVLYAMRAIFVSPHFLFIAESSPQQAGQPEPLTDHELATRLSYFLWASTPDDKLLQLADAGQLQEDEQLREQTMRLLKARGTHLRDSMEHFVGSWLGTADLGRTKKIDRERHAWVRDPHVAALRNQPIYALESILQNNDSILTLIDAPWTFLNGELVRVYKIRRQEIKADFVQRLVRVDLPESYRVRGGLLGMGGVLAVSSYPRRTSPVLRGAWVLEKMLGVELPPPPPNVPPLDESADVAQAQTVRQRLEQHRADPNCASCHDRIDPLGFALENFDELGRWRDRDDGGQIDALAELLDGTTIDGVSGLKQYLLEHRDTFARVLTRKMLGYALGRSLRPADLSTVEAIVERLAENDYRSHELLFGIVMSRPFREKMLAGSEEQ
jgi:mono/diheme cytochrome c family protein